MRTTRQSPTTLMPSPNIWANSSGTPSALGRGDIPSGRSWRIARLACMQAWIIWECLTNVTIRLRPSSYSCRSDENGGSALRVKGRSLKSLSNQLSAAAHEQFVDSLRCQHRPTIRVLSWELNESSSQAGATTGQENQSGNTHGNTAHSRYRL